jgi:hypothetical protein
MNHTTNKPEKETVNVQDTSLPTKEESYSYEIVPPPPDLNSTSKNESKKNVDSEIPKHSGSGSMREVALNDQSDEGDENYPPPPSRIFETHSSKMILSKRKENIEITQLPSHSSTPMTTTTTTTTTTQQPLPAESKDKQTPIKTEGNQQQVMNLSISKSLSQFSIL